MMRQTQVAVGQNFLAGLTGGMQAGQNIRQANDQNALRNIFATQDISDPSVQQQIMGLDPKAGMQLQNQTHQRDRQAQIDARTVEERQYQRGRDAASDSRAEQQFEMQVKEHAAKMSSAQRQQAAAKIEAGLMQAIPLVESGDLNGFNALLQSAGEEPIASMDQAPAVLRKYETVFNAVKDVRDFNAGPKPQSAPGKLAADLDAGVITPEQYNSASQKSGMRVTSDGDGGFTFEQGAGVIGGQNAPLGKAANTEIDKMEIGSRNTLSRLDRINANLEENPQILNAQTLQGQLKTFGITWKDFLTGDLTKDQAEYLVEVTNLRGDVLENVNATIKEITGAAMGVEEAKRIIATLPNVDDGPTVFEAKLNRALESTRMAVARANYWRNNGIEGDPTGVASLGEMPALMKSRAAEVYKDELTKGDPATARDRAKARLVEEFGIE